MGTFQQVWKKMWKTPEAKGGRGPGFRMFSSVFLGPWRLRPVSAGFPWGESCDLPDRAWVPDRF